MAIRPRKPARKYHILKPAGHFTARVQAVGPERFGVLCFDCAKARSKWMLANFYGAVLVPPQPVEHTRGHLDAIRSESSSQSCRSFSRLFPRNRFLGSISITTG